MGDAPAVVDALTGHLWAAAANDLSSDAEALHVQARPPRRPGSVVFEQAAAKPRC